MSLDPLQLTDLLAEPFYELHSPLGKDSSGVKIVKPGQLVTCNVVYPASRPQMLKLDHLNIDDPARSSFLAVNYSAGADPDFPVKELGLEDDERFFILKGKGRKCVVLQTVTTDFLNRRYPEPLVWVGPCFTFKIRHTAEYQARLAAMKFPHLFYMPHHPNGLASKGALRFELAQAVPASDISPELKDGKIKVLSDKAWAILQHRLCAYVCGRGFDTAIGEIISEYGDMVMEAFMEASKASVKL